MFKKKVNDYEWKVNNEEIKDSFFRENKDYFKSLTEEILKIYLLKCK